MKIAIIGGTGKLGYGLALRFAAAGHDVTIGSRSQERAESAAGAANEVLGRLALAAAEYAAAAQIGEIVILAVPFEAQEATALAIRDAAAGKVVVDATIPLAAGDPTRVEMPPEGSAAERTQRLLPRSPVVAAFHHVGAKALTRLDHPVEADLLICGDDQGAKAAVAPLAEALGTRAIDCGPLRQAQVLERLTPLLIGINIRYKRRHAGIKLTGV